MSNSESSFYPPSQTHSRKANTESGKIFRFCVSLAPGAGWRNRFENRETPAASRDFPSLFDSKPGGSDAFPPAVFSELFSTLSKMKDFSPESVRKDNERLPLSVSADHRRY